MGITILSCVLGFAGLLAILHFGYEEAEKERARRADAEALHAHARATGRSADELVQLIERRIDSDLQEAASRLRRAAAGPRRT